MSKDNLSFKNIFKTPSRNAPAIEKIIKYSAVSAQYVNKCETMQVNQNHYYKHMPKSNAADATLYASKLGGEDLDQCEIF